MFNNSSATWNNVSGNAASNARGSNGIHLFLNNSAAAVANTEENSNPEGHDLRNTEEVIVYIFVAILVTFFLTLLVRCVRITLDPYNTIARSSWFETLGRGHMDAL